MTATACPDSPAQPSSLCLLALCRLLLIACAGVVAATGTDIITTVAGGVPSSDPLRVAVGLPIAITVGPDGTLYWAASTQIFHRHVDGTCEIVAGRRDNVPAGSGNGGPAVDANLGLVTAICLNGQGDLFICGPGSVRMVSANTGIITAVASGFSNIAGIAADGAGNLYIADAGGNRIHRAVAGTWSLSVVAGNGTNVSNGDGGLATAAGLASPTSVVVDGSGNMFIADQVGQRLRRVDAVSQVITTIAGNGTQGSSGDGGPAAASKLSYPYSVAMDGAGNLFLSTPGSSSVRRIAAADGTISRVAGNGAFGYAGDDGMAVDARLAGPYAIAVDAGGNLFVADHDNNRIREVRQDTGIITTVAGNGTSDYGGDGGPAAATQLGACKHALVASNGSLLVVDSTDGRILSVAPADGLITTIAGLGSYLSLGDGGPALPAGLHNPSRLAFDGSGSLLILDTNHDRVRRVDSATGAISTVAGSATRGFTGDGGQATAAAMSAPYGMSVATNGDIYIADTENNRIRKVSASTHAITTVAGSGPSGYVSSNFSGDGGLATNARLSLPQDVLVDGAGNLYIADSYNNRIRFVSALTGIITTVAGTGVGGPGKLDGGPATSAHIFNPAGLAMNADGDLFISDSTSIRRIDHLTKVITTFAGNDTSGFSGDGGPATSGQLYSPSGLAFNAQGDLLIGDAGNRRVRLVAHQTTPSITWAPLALVYGNPLSADQLNATTTVAGTFAYSPPLGTVLTAGTSVLSVLFTPTDGLHSTSVTQTVSLTIAPAPLDLVADAQTRQHGAANPLLTYHLDGLVNGDDASVLVGVPALSTTATPTSSPGSYPIIIDATGVTAANYSLTVTAGTLVITAAPAVSPPPSSANGGPCGLGSAAAVLVGLALLVITLGTTLIGGRRRP